MIIACILFNVVTENFIVHTTLAHLIPSIAEFVPFLASKSIMWIISLWVLVTGIFQTSL